MTNGKNLVHFGFHWRWMSLTAHIPKKWEPSQFSVASSLLLDVSSTDDALPDYTALLQRAWSAPFWIVKVVFAIATLNAIAGNTRITKVASRKTFLPSFLGSSHTLKCLLPHLPPPSPLEAQHPLPLPGPAPQNLGCYHFVAFLPLCLPLLPDCIERHKNTAAG